MEIPNSHLFIATLKDGTQITQTLEDKSTTTEDKNAFYDVLQNLHELKCFVLKNDKHVYGVDLEDGHFEIDGIPFFSHEKPVDNFRLIYFRNVEVSSNVTYETETGGIIDTQDMGYSLSYILGWQANDQEGKNQQRIIKVWL